MLPCMRLPSSTATSNGVASSPVWHGSCSDQTQASSFQPSPTVNLSREYTLAVQTDFYREIWSKIHYESHSDENVVIEFHEEPQLLEQILQPSHEFVVEALSHIKATTLTELVTEYFEHSECTTRLCISLHHNVHHARVVYSPLSDLLEILSLDLNNSSFSLSQAQCDRAFDVFLQFEQFENPFPSPGNYNFNNMRRCFSSLKEQLSQRLDKSRSRLNFFNHATCCSALCLVATVIGVAISAALIATHTLVAIFAIPLCPVCFPSSMSRKETSLHAQLDAAAKGAYVLHNELDTTDRLVTRLRAAFESDKRLIRLGLEMGKEKHSIQEVLKQLCKTHSSFLQQLNEFDKHLCLCCSAVNSARGLLLREILPS